MADEDEIELIMGCESSGRAAERELETMGDAAPPVWRGIAARARRPRRHHHHFRFGQPAYPGALPGYPGAPPAYPGAPPPAAAAATYTGPLPSPPGNWSQGQPWPPPGWAPGQPLPGYPQGYPPPGTPMEMYNYTPSAAAPAAPAYGYPYGYPYPPPAPAAPPVPAAPAPGPQPTIDVFVGNMLAAGIPGHAIVGALRRRGCTPRQISAAIGRYLG